MIKYLKVIIKALFPIIWAYFSWMIRYSKNPNKYPLELRWKKIQKLDQKVLKAFGVNINDTDINSFYEKYDVNKNHLFISNHRSDVDPLIYIALSKRPISFLAKIETKKYPLIGRCIKILNGDFLNREDLKQNLKVMKVIEEKLKSDIRFDYMIFPEGTRNKENNSKVLSYHHGTFRPAFKSNLPLDVFVIYGEDGILSFKDKRKEYNVIIKHVLSLNEKDYIGKNTQDIALICESNSNITLSKITNLSS